MIRLNLTALATAATVLTTDSWLVTLGCAIVTVRVATTVLRELVA